MIFNFKRVWLGWAILSLTAACHKGKDGVSPTPSATCKVMTWVDSAWNEKGVPVHMDVYDLEYDDKDHIRALSIASSDVNVDGSLSAVGSESDIYQYDNNGLMTAWNRTQMFGGHTIQTYNTFQSDKERLARSDNANSYDGVQNGLTAVFYQYDNTGNLIKYLDSSSGGIEFYNYSYLNGKLNGISYTSSGGATTNANLDISAKGLPTRIVLNGIERDFQYDAEGQMTEVEVWGNNSPVYKLESTYDYSRKAAPLIIYPLPKSPSNIITPPGNAPPTPVNHNLIDYKIYGPSGAVFSLATRRSYTYFYNKTGYPDSTIVNYSDGDGRLIGKHKNTYTYTGCK